MAQTVTISTAGKIPDSKAVKAYLMSQVPEKKRAPIGEKLAEATTSGGVLTLSGLPDNTQVQLAYEESSVWIYPMTLTTPAVGKGSGLTTVVAANTLTLPAGVGAVEVTGTTEIKKIVAGNAGEKVMLIFKETPKVVQGENLKIAATFEATNHDVLHLVTDGVNWYGAGTSVNP